MHVRLIYPVIFLFFFASCNQNTQQAASPGTTASIAVKWELLSNFQDTGYKARFYLLNKGERTLTDKNWKMFFSIAPSPILSNTTPQPADVEHINGDWFKLYPNPGFSLKQGDSVVIDYRATGYVIKNTDQPLGIYIVFYDDNGNEESIANIDDYTLIPYAAKEQLLRGRDDRELPASAEKTFIDNSGLVALPEDQLLPIIPTPLSFSKFEGIYELNIGTITFSDSLSEEARLLAARLKEITGKDFSTKAGAAGQKGIYLSIDSDALTQKKQEAYRLTINDQGINITGYDAAGVFYGIQSLLSLIPTNVYLGKEQRIKLPYVTIDDAPRFAFRSLHVDVSRNFQSKENIFRILDVLAQYKINRMLLYTSEDEGWRVEIPGLPELTEVGAKRLHVSGKDAPALHPAYGSGPFADSKDNYGTGYYTRKDFIEILKYAQQRHISIIPELNFPGHARAAIKSMEARYERLMKEGKKEEAEEYRLADPDDQSVYISAQMYKDNVVDVTRESAYRFYEKVVEEFGKMYKEAGLTMREFHAGGDEVADGAWTKSPHALGLMQQHPEIKNAKNIQAYFFRELLKRLEKKGLEIHGWEEAFLIKDSTGNLAPNAEFAGKPVVPYIWNNMFDYPDLGYRLANQGYNVVLCNVSNFYFDLAYNNDPAEPGLYWAGFIDTKNAWAFAPFNMFNTTFKSSMGDVLEWDKPNTPWQKLKPEAQKNIKGLEAQLWSETIKGRDMIEYYMLPKLIGFSESAWSPERKWEKEPNRKKRMEQIDEGWNQFANTIAQKEFPKLAHINGGYNYRVPPAGVVIEKGEIKANVALPGISIHYTTDGTEPTMQSPVYTAPVPATATFNFKTFDASGKPGRTITVKKAGTQRLN
ncbi:MAG: carbohydate-binding domain-containing protein [Terrimonas sp.]|nr:carbohydate-binding domain-containing protein [Terrimonas sp.]OJY79677.1 MAG: beta-N-acetylhexosaminidase [Sphingobacteriales bacterium 40-81]